MSDWTDTVIHHDADGWWFWDETGSDRVGPYFDEAQCRSALMSYCKWLDECENRTGET